MKETDITLFGSYKAQGGNFVSVTIIVKNSTDSPEECAKSARRAMSLVCGEEK